MVLEKIYLLRINLKNGFNTSCTVFMNSSLLSYEFHFSSYFVYRIIVFLRSMIIELFVYPLLTCGSVLCVSWKRGVLCVSIVFMWQVVWCDNNDIRTTFPLFPNQKLFGAQTDKKNEWITWNILIEMLIPMTDQHLFPEMTAFTRFYVFPLRVYLYRLFISWFLPFMTCINIFLCFICILIYIFF